MRHFVSSDRRLSSDGISVNESTIVSTASYLKRKIHPEQQALTAEELAELVKADFVAHVHEERDTEELDTVSCNKDSTESKESSISNVESLQQPHFQKEKGKDLDSGAENWANFDEMKQEINSKENNKDKMSESERT